MSVMTVTSTFYNKLTHRTARCSAPCLNQVRKVLALETANTPRNVLLSTTECPRNLLVPLRLRSSRSELVQVFVLARKMLLYLTLQHFLPFQRRTKRNAWELEC